MSGRRKAKQANMKGKPNEENKNEGKGKESKARKTCALKPSRAVQNTSKTSKQASE